MKRITITLAMLCMLVGLFLTPGAVKAEDVLNQVIPVTGAFFDNCTGEVIQYTGEVHVLITQTVTPDGTTHTHQHANLHATAVGLTSGNQYEVNSDFITREIKSADACGYKYNQVERDNLISKGSQPNLKVVLGLSLEQDDNCFFTSDVTMKSDCKG